jgi:hypothetical protein
MAIKQNPAKSLNFWTTIITIIMTALFTVTGVEVDFRAEDVAQIILTEEGLSLLSTLFLLLFTPLFKTYQRIKENGYDWAKLKSRNMLAHLSSLLILLAGIWLDAEKLSFVVVLLTQLVNFIAHRFNFK